MKVAADECELNGLLMNCS